MIGDIYEVYVCKLDDEILYVGQGKSGRHRHCNSGISHVYDLNTLHFNGIKTEVDVVYTSLSKLDVEKMEMRLIKELQPKFNKVGNPKSESTNFESKANISSFFNLLKSKDKLMWRKHGGDLAAAYIDMQKIHKSIDHSKEFCYDTNFKYESRKLYGLRRMANNFKKTKTYSVYFLECYNEIFYKPE